MSDRQHRGCTLFELQQRRRRVFDVPAQPAVRVGLVGKRPSHLEQPDPIAKGRFLFQEALERLETARDAFGVIQPIDCQSGGAAVGFESQRGGVLSKML